MPSSRSSACSVYGSSKPAGPASATWDRVLRVRGKGGKVVLVPLPPAVGRAIDCAVGSRTEGSILRNTLGARMDRHAATRRLKHLAQMAGIRMPRMHPHMLRFRDHHA
jgi:integrase/recombinase XerD